ncbi:FAD-dependent oxidoreductase [Williamsia herbipolensis]|uniref:FAD-dependent oxidoreductase n=1 Tax=Williamsia herbipolensis TaxID=1603258 RepID=A0AAU4K450_9NOCA|nr:FAD-dependent oxidoreductase [Williamsia herbipolensis]
MNAPKVIVAGLGDSGLLTAIHLAKHADVVGVSSKPGLVSGQELGSRLGRPEEWSRNYWLDFGQYRGLDTVRTVHASLTATDLDAKTVTWVEDGESVTEAFDALVISTGVTNGFWRSPALQSTDEVAADIASHHDRVARSARVMVVGGGAAAVSTAANIALRWPEKRVDLYFPGDRALPQHHPRTWKTVRRRLLDAGVTLHPGHRAVVPHDFHCDRITSGAVRWQTEQATSTADAIIWAIGRVRPNSGWLPSEVLDVDGFVRVNRYLQLPEHPAVFAVGDVAASDPLRGSARNRADKLVARNVMSVLNGRRPHSYHPRRRRWGSVLGVQPDGLQVFAPNGRATRIPRWSTDRVLQPLVVRRGIYGGVRDTPRSSGQPS